MKHKYNIEYGDIILRPINLDFCQKYRRLRNIPDVNKWFTNKDIISYNQQRHWYYDYLKRPNDIMFAILNSNGEFIGGNSIYNIHNSEAEFGRLIIDPLYTGNGYGFQATYAAALIARNQLKLEQLILEVYEDNIPARKTYQHVGFVERGRIFDDNNIPMVSMILLLNKL